MKIFRTFLNDDKNMFLQCRQWLHAYCQKLFEMLWKIDYNAISNLDVSPSNNFKNINGKTMCSDFLKNEKTISKMNMISIRMHFNFFLMFGEFYIKSKMQIILYAQIKNFLYLRLNIYGFFIL